MHATNLTIDYWLANHCAIIEQKVLQYSKTIVVAINQ